MSIRVQLSYEQYYNHQIKSDLPYITTQLKFHRISPIIEEQPKHQEQEGKIKGNKRCSYILGVFKTYNKSFIVIVEECTIVATIQDQIIHHIDQVSYVAIDVKHTFNQKTILLITIKRFLKLQVIKKKNCNQDYTFHSMEIQLLQDILKNMRIVLFGIINYLALLEKIRLLVPMIQGYVEQIDFYIDKQPIKVVLISRRSRFMEELDTTQEEAMMMDMKLILWKQSKYLYQVQSQQILLSQEDQYHYFGIKIVLIK